MTYKWCSTLESVAHACRFIKRCVRFLYFIYFFPQEQKDSNYHQEVPAWRQLWGLGLWWTHYNRLSWPELRLNSKPAPKRIRDRSSEPWTAVVKKQVWKRGIDSHVTSFYFYKLRSQGPHKCSCLGRLLNQSSVLSLTLSFPSGTFCCMSPSSPLGGLQNTEKSMTSEVLNSFEFSFIPYILSGY